MLTGSGFPRMVFSPCRLFAYLLMNLFLLPSYRFKVLLLL